MKTFDGKLISVGMMVYQGQPKPVKFIEFVVLDCDENKQTVKIGRNVGDHSVQIFNTPANTVHSSPRELLLLWRDQVQKQLLELHSLALNADLPIDAITNLSSVLEKTEI